jgi:hypothetical protein
MGALWGTHSATKRREEVECAAGSKLTTHIVTVPEGGWYLLPVKGWYSDDLAYLKTLLWWRYFRDEAPPPREDDLIAIEGFGDYRPAALADPYHPASRALPFPATSSDVQHTGLRAGDDGNVYAAFPADIQASVAERRAQLLDAALAPSMGRNTHLGPPTTSPLAQRGVAHRSESLTGDVEVTLHLNRSS